MYSGTPQPISEHMNWHMLLCHSLSLPGSPFIVSSFPFHSITASINVGIQTSRYNATFIIVAEEKIRYITPQELIDSWNKLNNTQEGVLAGLLDNYLGTQAILCKDILDLTDLINRLKETALMHDPSGLMNYVDLLISSAKAGVKEGSANELLITQLTTARKTLQLLHELRKKDRQISSDLVILVDVLDLVRREMMRRITLGANDRADEERKPCSLYNELRLKLPLDMYGK